jgi:hypothetical protein
LSSVLKVKAPNVRPSPHVNRPVNQVPTQLNHDTPYFNGQMSDIQARSDNQYFQISGVKIPATPATKFINRRFGNVHSDIQSINSQYSSRDTHPGTHLKTRHGVDATKHPGIQLINRNHVDSTTESEIQLINTIPPNRPGIKPDFWNLWSLSKTTENIKTDDMPTTPPSNHQVKGEGINYTKELDLRSKLPGIQQHGLHIKTANNVNNGASGVKTMDVSKKLQQNSEPRHQQQPSPLKIKKKCKTKRRLLETFRILGLCL